MKIALISPSDIIQVWSVQAGQAELPIRCRLPDGSQISPIVLGWSDGIYSVVAVSEFDVPEGKATVGPPSYEIINGEVLETYAVEDYRPMVRKSTVQARLIEAGKMADAYSVLTQYPVSFARWFAPDQPRIYCDDPDSVAFLTAMNLDPAIFLAPEPA